MVAGLLAATVLALAPAGAQARGNTVLTRERGPVFGVAAAVRLPILAGDGRRVIQPVGFGAELTFRALALHVRILRLGGELNLGHARFLERYTLTHDDGIEARDVTRWAALGHSHFALGPSLQLVLGPVMIEGGFSAGLGISTLVRPRDAFSEENVTDFTGMIRGGGHLAIPVRRNQGVLVGASVHKYFSSKQVVDADAFDDPDAEPNANPFDLVTDVYVGYQMWF